MRVIDDIDEALDLIEELETKAALLQAQVKALKEINDRSQGVINDLLEQKKKFWTKRLTTGV